MLHVVYRLDRGTPVIELHRRANSMSIKDRIQFNLLQNVHRQVMSANTLFPLVDSYATRASEQKMIRLPWPKTSRLTKSPYYRSIQAWNKIENDLRIINDPVIFKTRIESHFWVIVCNWNYAVFIWVCYWLLIYFLLYTMVITFLSTFNFFLYIRSE